MSSDEGASVTDEDLVGRYQADSEGPAGRRVATELFERYQERVYLWCFRRVRNHDQAVDLAQDALLAAFRGLARFEGRSHYASWLFTIARNRCFRAMRAPRLLDANEGEIEDIAEDRPGPDRALETKEETARLARLVETVLEPEERLAIWMRCEERLSVDEITRRLNLQSASGARGLLQTARRKLRAALERLEGPPGSRAAGRNRE